MIIGLVMGVMFKDHEINAIGQSNFMTVLVVCLIGMVQSIGLYREERDRFLVRSRPHGMTVCAYFLSKCAVSIIPLLLWPFVYLLVFYNISFPRGAAMQWYVVCLCGLFAIQSVAHLVAILGGGPFLGTLVALIVLMFSGSSPSLAAHPGVDFFRAMCAISPSRYMFEALWWLETSYSTDVLKQPVGTISFVGYGWRGANASDILSTNLLTNTLPADCLQYRDEALYGLVYIGFAVWAIAFCVLFIFGTRFPRTMAACLRCRDRSKAKFQQLKRVFEPRKPKSAAGEVEM